MTTPLFKWAGGKTKMLGHYAPLVPPEVTTYYEPFLGAGAMFLWVMKNRRPRRVVLNDVNEDLMSVYREIASPRCADFVREMDRLSERYLRLTYGARKDYYLALREEHTSGRGSTATFYFLLKTCFNGVYQLSKDGRFNTAPGRINHTSSVYSRHDVFAWHKLLKDVELRCGDWSAAVRPEKDAFHFLDPPYRGGFADFGYGRDFGDDQQAKLVAFAREAAAAGGYVMLCNRDVGDGFFEPLKGDLDLLTYDVKYLAGRRKVVRKGVFEAKRAREVLLTNCRSWRAGGQDGFGAGIPYVAPAQRGKITAGETRRR